jgi:hypothetical protein
MCGLVVSPKFLEQMGVDSSARSALFFAGVGCGEGEAVVATGAHIRFLIEQYIDFFLKKGNDKMKALN